MVEQSGGFSDLDEAQRQIDAANAARPHVLTPVPSPDDPPTPPEPIEPEPIVPEPEPVPIPAPTPDSLDRRSIPTTYLDLDPHDFDDIYYEAPPVRGRTIKGIGSWILHPVSNTFVAVSLLRANRSAAREQREERWRDMTPRERARRRIGDVGSWIGYATIGTFAAWQLARGIGMLYEIHGGGGTVPVPTPSKSPLPTTPPPEVSPTVPTPPPPSPKVPVPETPVPEVPTAPEQAKPNTVVVLELDTYHFDKSHGSFQGTVVGETDEKLEELGVHADNKALYLKGLETLRANGIGGKDATDAQRWEAARHMKIGTKFTVDLADLLPSNASGNPTTIPPQVETTPPSAKPTPATASPSIKPEVTNDTPYYTFDTRDKGGIRSAEVQQDGDIQLTDALGRNIIINTYVPKNDMPITDYLNHLNNQLPVKLSPEALKATSQRLSANPDLMERIGARRDPAGEYLLMSGNLYPAVMDQIIRSILEEIEDA